MLKNNQTINRFLVAILLIFIPLYPKFPLLMVPGSQVFIRLEDFIILGVFLVWLIVNRGKLLLFAKTKLAKSVLLFLLVGLLSLFSGYLLTHTISLPIAIVHWVRRVEYMIPLFIGLTAIKSDKDIYFYLRIIIITILFAFIYGIGQKHLSWPIITTQNQEYSKGVALYFVEGSHLPSTFAGHYDLAAFLVLVAPLIVILLTLPRTALKKLRLLPSVILTRLFLFTSHIMVLWLLVNAASRISVAAYLGVITISLILVRKYLLIPAILLISVGFILTSSKLMDRYVQILQVSVTKIISTETVSVKSVYAQATEKIRIPERRTQEAPQITSEVPNVLEDRSTSIRLNIEWPRAIRAFSKNFLLGTGYSSISLATDNDYLRLLGEVGLLGFMALFLIVGRGIYSLVPALPFKKELNIRQVFPAFFMSSLPGIMLIMVFIDILESSKFAIVFWLIFGIAISSTKLFKKKIIT